MAERNQQIVTGILRKAGEIYSGLSTITADKELTPPQFNVLRILRGAGKSLPCGEISNRMVTRDSDITRLLDRLEKMKLITRKRDDSDRRIVRASITRKGLAQLANLDGPVSRWEEKISQGLSGNEKTQLIQFLNLLGTNLEIGDMK